MNVLEWLFLGMPWEVAVMVIAFGAVCAVCSVIASAIKKGGGNG